MNRAFGSRGYRGHSGSGFGDGASAYRGQGGPGSRHNPAHLRHPSLPAELANKSALEVTRTINPEWDGEDSEEVSAAAERMKEQVRLQSQSSASVLTSQVSKTTTPLTMSTPSSAANTNGTKVVENMAKPAVAGANGHGASHLVTFDVNVAAASTAGYAGNRIVNNNSVVNEKTYNERPPALSSTVLSVPAHSVSRPMVGQPMVMTNGNGINNGYAGHVKQMPATLATPLSRNMTCDSAFGDGTLRSIDRGVQTNTVVHPSVTMTSSSGVCSRDNHSNSFGVSGKVVHSETPVVPTTVSGTLSPHVTPTEQRVNGQLIANGNAGIRNGSDHVRNSSSVASEPNPPGTVDKVKSYLSSLQNVQNEKSPKVWPVVDNPVREHVEPVPGQATVNIDSAQPLVHIAISPTTMNVGDGVAVGKSNGTLTPQIVISSDCPLLGSSIANAINGSNGSSGVAKEDVCSIATVSQKLFEAYSEMNSLLQRLSVRL